MAMTLRRADGPECPECGCMSSEIVSAPTPRFPGPIDPGDTDPECVEVWTRLQVRRRCDACSAEWTAATVTRNGLDRPVPFYPVVCPCCGGTDCPVQRTKRPTRRHTCRDCGHRFESFEATPPRRS